MTVVYPSKFLPPPHVEVLRARDSRGHVCWLLDYVWFDHEGENRAVVSDHYDFRQAAEEAREYQAAEGIAILWGGAP